MFMIILSGVGGGEGGTASLARSDLVVSKLVLGVNVNSVRGDVAPLELKYKSASRSPK